jgi:hypothetical protein
MKFKEVTTRRCNSLQNTEVWKNLVKKIMAQKSCFGGGGT